jgi:4-hydroxybenzoate polyprenyltransferase
MLLLRVGSIRFTAFYLAAFYTALAATGHGDWRWFALGLPLWLIQCLAIELTNRYSDRIEDAVNRPERTALCEQVGYATVRWVAIGCNVLALAFYIAWFVEWRRPQLFAVQIISWLVMWNYSVGLRFKALRVGVLVALTGTFILPFLCGWMIYGELAQMPPSILVMLVFVFSLSGIKDITDVEGDAQRGYRSLFVDLASRRSALRLLLLLSSPYLVMAVFVALGLAPVRFLALAVLSPLSLLFASLVRGARSDSERTSVREWTYHFWFIFLLALLLLMHPAAETAAGLGASALLWVVATRHFHWAVGLRADQAADAGRILARAFAAR